MKTLKNYIYSFLEIIIRERRRRYWICLMKRNISSLDTNGGGRKLTNNQKNSIQNVFQKAPHFSYVSHIFYTIATGRFFPNYMPDSLYYQYIDPFYNNWNMASFLDHKGLYRNMFPGAKQPKLLTYRMNGFWYNENGIIINQEEAISAVMHSKNSFIKQAVESEGGHGIIFVDSSKQTPQSLKKLLDFNNLDIVVQEGLEQSSTLSCINSSSVNTIRLLTLLKRDGNVKIYSSLLRVGINGAKVDNASCGGITVGIEENGRLKSCAYSNKGVRFYQHPTSGVKFSDFTIPNFEEVKHTVIEQAKNFPHFRLISWDIALEINNNPVIIEANLKYGEIDIHQLNNGPLFGDDTKEILNEVFAHKHKKLLF